MPCACTHKIQDQAYYNKRIDEEISEWLKEVPVHSIECSDSKKKRETVVKELRKTLKLLPDDENFGDNAGNEIQSFVDDFPLWNPGKDKKDEKLFKNQLADKLTDRIVSIPRKPDRFRDIVKKWIVGMDFEDDGEDVDEEAIISKFVDKLKTLAAERPACDIKYTNTLRKEIIELLVELALKFDGDMLMLKKIANKLATEIVSIPRNVNLSGDTTDLTEEFEENLSDWICEHGLCRELKKDPKLIEGLAKKLNKLKSQGIDDECVVEKMKAEIHQFVDDVGIVIETMDELIDELMKQLSNTVQTNEMERLDQDEVTEISTDWLRNLPGAADLDPRKFEKIVKELVKMIIEGREQGNENLANDILNYLVEADLPIDPADLAIYVEELMKKLNILPSEKYHKEQVKKEMLKDIFDIIENLSMPQNKKQELRNKAHAILEYHLNNSALNSKDDHDDVMEGIMGDMDDFISTINLPKESRFQLKNSLSRKLSSNFGKSLMRLRRLSGDGSNLKQTIAKDVRNAVKELPIDPNKKKDLMQQVKGTLSKSMHKPLPSNVKNTINDEISDIVERCPISKDRSIAGSLKKILSAVASKHLNICLPKCVCDIQSKVEKDVGIVIDKSSIDTRTKKELKKSIQDILAENEDRKLSDEVLKTIKKDISGVVSDLSIPQDKKDVLKKTVSETISKDFDDALSNLRHDLNKVRNKLFEDICNAIEKSPIPRVVKTHLINKLKSVLARNLDSSLSDEEKYTILDDVSNIVKDDMPAEKRISLTNKLAKKLDTQQRKEDTTEVDELTKNLKELELKILDYILLELEQTVESAPIPSEEKIQLKKKLKNMATIDYKKPADDIAEDLLDRINEILDELNLPEDKTNELKNELAAAIDEYSKLLRQIKDVETEYYDRHNQQIGKGLMPIEEFDEKKAKENILQGIEDIIEESVIPEEIKTKLKWNLKKMATDHMKKPFNDDVQDAIKMGIADILDELQIPKSEKDQLKRALINMTDDYLDNLREAKQPVEELDEKKAKESILQGIENITEESDIPEEKKMEIKRKLKKMATDNLKKPFSDDVQDAIKMGIADILDELQIPKSEKNKLKRDLITMTDGYLDNLREAKQPAEEFDEPKARQNILQGIEKIIEESDIPEEKKMEMKRKLKKMATDNLKKPFSDDVQDAIKMGIADILDELQIPKSEKNKLKRELIKMTDDNLDNLREAKQVRSPKSLMPIAEVDETNAKESILQGIEKIIEESDIPEEKKMEMKRKLKKMASDNLKKPFSDDVQDAIKMGIADILDELQIPKSEKNKLKRELIKMTDKNLDNLREAKQPAEEFDKPKARQNILQGIEKIIEESAIPEEKKMDLKRNLKKMATDNLKKPFSDDVQDAIKMGIADILDELQIPKSEKNKLKRDLITMTDGYLDNLREAKQPAEEFDEPKARQNILQGIEKIIEESAIPEEKKMELKTKLKKMATDNLKKPFSDDVQDAIKMGIADILEELQIPKSEKKKLNRDLINMTDEYLNNLREAKQPTEEFDEPKARKNILQGIEKIIEESAIPEEKKMDLKRNLKKMATDNLKKPFSNDVQDAIKMGIADILDELQIPKSEKNKLNRDLITMTDGYLDNLREAKQPAEEFDEPKARQNILQGIEKIIEESAIPEEKKMELKTKLKTMATDNLKKPFSGDVQDAIKMGIADILEELQIPKSEKKKLNRDLINMTDEYLNNLREAKQPTEEFDEPKARKNILQGIEKIIEESAIPEEKKMDLKRNLKKMATDNLKNPFSNDVQDAIKMGIADILDELQIPKSEKNKLKRELIKMTDKNLDNLREAKQPAEEFDESKAKRNILQGIEKIIEESAIPEEKKMELKTKLKKMATDNLKKPFSGDVQDAIKMGIADTLDELQIPKSEKNKLKRNLITMTDKNLDNWREAKQPVEEVDESKAKRNILQGIEKIIEESAIPEEKKMELKTKLKKMATDNLKKPFSGDVQDAIKMGIADILEELQIPKSEKKKLNRDLINMTDEYLDNLREAKQPTEEFDEPKARKNILQGIEKIIEESAIPEEKKMDLKRNLKKMATDNLKKPFSDDVQDAIKMGIADILDELQIPKSDKNKLKRELIKMTDKNLDNLREAKQPVGEVDESKAKGNILQGIEKIIEESAIPEEKKMEMKRKLKKMATDNLKKPFSNDVQDAIKIGIADIIDEQPIPKSEKNKLKRALINMTDHNLDNLREPKQVRSLKSLMPIAEVDETNAKESILQGIEKIIEESAIPEEKKMELKRKLKKMATDHLKKPFSDDVQDAIKMGIADTLDELQIPNSEKNKLKRALVNMVDENVVDNLRGVPPKLSSQVNDFKELESESQNDILLSLEKAIDEAPIPLDKKREFKKKLKNLATKNFQKPLSDDTAEALKDLKKERKNESNSAKSMPDEKRNKLNIIIRRVLPEFDEAVDPSYQKQLAEDFDELLEIAVTDGDFKDARKKLIKKLMREQNLSEKEASGPVDELIGRAREMALKEDIGDERYELDPKYVKTLEPDISKLVDIALVGGDFEDARKKLTKKLMREQNLPEEKASACADDLIAKAQKLALVAQSKDKSQLFKEALAKAIGDAVDRTTMSKPDKSSLKDKLLSKLKQTLDKKPFINKDDLEPLKTQVLKDLKKIVDESSIPTDKKNELKSLMNEDLANTIDEIMDDYDVEEGYTKPHTKAISKAVNKSPIPNLEKSNLKKDLAKTFDGILDDFDNKITKHKEAFTRAINDAVDQSTLSKPDKSSLKNKLLNKMKQTVDESPHINDTGALKAEVLKDCKNVVDDSSIPIGKKSELKLLLKEEIMDDYDDDKTTKHKEAFTKAINDAVDQSTLSKPDKSSQKNKLLSKLNETMDNSPNLNDIGALIGEVLKDSKNVVDDSSIPIGKKSELKSLLQEALAGTAKELMDDYDDEDIFAKEKSPEYEDKLNKYKEAFAKAINGAVDKSTLPKPDKNGQKNKLLSKLNETIDNSPNLNDIGALIAEILKDSKKVVDTSSIPNEKKNELKLLLQEAMAGAAKELMDDEDVSREAFATFQDKIAETVKTWMDNLPIDLDPNDKADVAKDIASDILDRLKYLQLHPEAITTDKDEIENLKYQIFRRMKNLVDSKDIPPIMEGTEELYRMIMELDPPPGFPKLRREQRTSETRRRDPVPQERNKSTSCAFSTGNINHSLKELIATSKSIRKQWSKNLGEAVTKLPLPKNEKCFMKEKLAIYDEAGQGRMLSTKSKSKEETNTIQGTKLKKYVAPKSTHVAPKTAQKNNKGKVTSRLSKIDRALTFTNTTKQKSPFKPKQNQVVDEKQFTKFATDTIKAWLEKVQINIEPEAKNRIIEELTNDVVDRKKYLQIYGSAEPTRTDDLDYLKLQVHRRLNAFVPAEALKAVIVDTKVLLATIDTVTMKTASDSAKNTKSPVSQKTGNKQGIADILDSNGKATNTANGGLNEMEQESSNMEFNPRKTSTPGKSNGELTPEEYKNKIAEAIKTWIDGVPIELAPEAETDFIDELTNDIVDRKKYLQVQPDKMISKKEEIENLRFQVFKRLISADPDASETPDFETVEDLYKMIGEGRRKSLSPKQAEEFKTALNAEISAILDDYNICCDRRDLHPSLANELTKLAKNNADQDEIVENLIDSIKRLTYLSPCLCDEEAEELAHKLLYKTKKLIARIQDRDRQIAAGTAVKKKDFKEAVMNDIGDVFDGCPMTNEKRTLMENQLAEDYAKDLGIPLEDSDVTMNGTGLETKKEGYGMSFNGLTNFIDNWLSSINTDDETKGEDEMKDMKKDMAYSLIHKIGEMNVDPEIFNDDSLYESILRDELQNLLGDITISDDDIQALKEDLIEKVLEAQHRAHDEIAGQIYKKNLRDTISKLLPDQRNLSKEEQDGMETLKDQLADAYIDLHYSGGNEYQRERSKKIIADEINNFCRDYLYRNPCSPLNSRTLNQNLYNALNKVPLPTGDSIRYEVEQARIREEINDWIKELPLQPQNPTEVLARNKLVYLLSKKLFDIEVEGNDTDNELMKKEIVKFLNKIPLESGEDKDTLADKLIDKLKATQVSRKYDASSNVTLDAFGNVSSGSNRSCMNAPICRPYQPLATPCSSNSPQVCRRPCPREPKPFPPCTLSPEDRAHLERIKRRTCLSPNCVNTFMRNNKRNTGVGPRPVDAGSQTVLRPFGMETRQSPICSINNERPRPCPGLSANQPHPPCSHMRRDPFEMETPQPSPICPAAHENTSRPCPGPSRPSQQNGHQMRRHTISSGNIESPIEEEVQPQIIIKQYYWNPNDKNGMVDSDLQHSGRSSRRQSNLLPCHQPSPPPCHQPGPPPCHQPSPPPCHQPGPPPCHQPSPPPCHQPGPPPCHQPGPPCHQTGSAPCDQTRRSSYAQSTPAPCPHSSFGKLQQQNTSPQRMPCDESFTSPEPKSQHEPSPERYSYWDPQSSFQGPSQRDLPSEESSFTPSPCMSPFGLNQQPSPPCSPGFSKREHEYRIPKRDGLQDQMPCSSRPCRKERVIELGSLDDVPNVRPKKRHSDQSDWPYNKFQEEDNFWGLPMRRVILDEGINESLVMEREQREERIRCRCKERLVPKNGRTQPRTCSSQEIPKNGRFQPRTCPSQEIPQGTEDENLKKCSKCCGRHCPYPSFLYFRQ